MGDVTATFNALRTRLEAFTALPLYWPNDDRTPSIKDAPNGWVYSECRVVDERPATLGPTGSRWHRDFGELAVYVYVPRGSRVGTAEAYAEQIRALFKMDSVGGVNITRRTIGNGQGVEGGAGGKMYAIPIAIEWWADRLE